MGSPPHTWRIQTKRVQISFLYGITSTHVENTNGVTAVASAIKDHLHTRGEYCFNNSVAVILLGSPPHTWRILTEDQKDGLQERITSTHVENTMFYLMNMETTRDHLHTRGEYSKQIPI